MDKEREREIKMDCVIQFAYQTFFRGPKDRHFMPVNNFFPKYPFSFFFFLLLPIFCHTKCISLSYLRHLTMSFFFLKSSGFFHREDNQHFYISSLWYVCACCSLSHSLLKTLSLSSFLHFQFRFFHPSAATRSQTSVDAWMRAHCAVFSTMMLMMMTSVDQSS